jgi:sporulation protein YlmC with PRC-barrel domain
VELNDAPLGVGHLIGARVHDAGGRKLGRVHELRGHRRDDGTVVVDHLLLGPRSFWIRLRGPSGADPRAIPWEAVVEVGPERIIVSSAASALSRASSSPAR